MEDNRERSIRVVALPPCALSQPLEIDVAQIGLLGVAVPARACSGPTITSQVVA